MMYEYRARVTRVVDGDTLHATVDLGCDVFIDMTVRLAGINCPELPTDEGKVAQQFATAWVVDHAQQVVIRTYKDRKEKYGRYLGIVTPSEHDANNASLNQALLDAGHAVPYGEHVPSLREGVAVQINDEPDRWVY